MTIIIIALDQFILKLLGIRQLEPTNKVLQFFDEVACDFSTEEEKVCENLVFLLTGYDDKQMNKVTHVKALFSIG